MGLFGKKDQTKEYTDIVHVVGLPIPENCKCKVMLKTQEMVISGAGTEMTLLYEKIHNVDFQMDIDESIYQKSSLAKGIVGAATFGVAGAVLGSAPKTKTKREVKCYAIVTYQNADGEAQTFVLRDEYPNTQKCAKLIEQLKPQITARMNRVEL